MKKIVLATMIVVAVAMSAVAQADFGTLIVNHQIATGMSYEGVVAAWGEPNSVARTMFAYGALEAWFMKNGWVVEFEKGRVVRFYDSGQAHSSSNEK